MKQAENKGVLLPEEFIDRWKQHQIEIRIRRQEHDPLRAQWDCRYWRVVAISGATVGAILAIAWWLR